MIASLVLLTLAADTVAQVPVMNYSVKDGRMFIALGKKLNVAALDSFINQYDLADLDLKTFFKKNTAESLKKLGWRIDVNNNDLAIISKPLFSSDMIGDPVDKIIFTYKNQLAADPNMVNNASASGYNRWRKRYAFAVKDSVVSFYLRDNLNAAGVKLAGSFSNWAPDAIPMAKTDSGWIAYVNLPPGKYWYKFIVDGNWTTDNDNLLQENDGQGNINSVYYQANHVFRLNGRTNAKKVEVAGSFNNWDGRGGVMKRTATGWELPIFLPEGTHTYRFVADGHWFEDPANPDKVPNEFAGEFNSVVKVGNAHTFQLEGYPDAKRVVLTGSFNAWKKDELFMIKTATGWELPYTLGEGNYEYQFLVEGKTIADPANAQPGAKSSYLVIGANYTFHLKGYAGAKKVYLAGDFNNWTPGSLLMKREADEWVFSVHLSAGKHLYKFVIDDKWILDPGNPLWEQNETGSGNSIVWIEH